MLCSRLQVRKVFTGCVRAEAASKGSSAGLQKAFRRGLGCDSSTVAAKATAAGRAAVSSRARVYITFWALAIFNDAQVRCSRSTC